MTDENSKHPQHVDHYRIERVIYECGDRVVFRAFDEKENRASAVKVGKSLLSTRSASYDAWREGRLDHPYILKFHSSGKEGNNEYLAAEFADGGTLDGFLGQVRTSIPSGVKISVRIKGEYITSMAQRFFDLTTALAHIHANGLHHGNLKPSNVAICTNRNYLKLTDVGPKQNLNETTAMSMSDIAYAAPETMHGDRKETDWRRADVYSLGIIMYETFTLSLPFDGSDTKRYVSQSLTSRPVPASSRNSSLPRAIERVIMKATARDPSERYQSALELADDLQRVLTDEKVEAPEIGAGDRVLGGLKLHWRATLIVLIIIAVGGLIFFRDYLY